VLTDLYNIAMARLLSKSLCHRNQCITKLAYITATQEQQQGAHAADVAVLHERQELLHLLLFSHAHTGTTTHEYHVDIITSYVGQLFTDCCCTVLSTLVYSSVFVDPR
jgi:hypothetical protein